MVVAQWGLFDFDSLEVAEATQNADDSVESEREAEQGSSDSTRFSNSACLAQETESIQRTTCEPTEDRTIYEPFPRTTDEPMKSAAKATQNVDDYLDSERETEQGSSDSTRFSNSACLAQESEPIERTICEPTEDRTTYEPIERTTDEPMGRTCYETNPLLTFNLLCVRACPSSPVKDCSEIKLKPRRYTFLKLGATTLHEFSMLGGAIVCPLTHGLHGFITEEDDYTCSFCEQSFPKRTFMIGCRQCDYDLCTPCVEFWQDQSSSCTQFEIGDKVNSQENCGASSQGGADCYSTDWSHLGDRFFNVQIVGALSNELITEFPYSRLYDTLREVKQFLAEDFNTTTWRFLSEGQLLEDREVLSSFISPSGVCVFQVLKDANRDFVARWQSSDPEERIAGLRDIGNFLELGIVTTANAKDVTPLLSDGDLRVRMEAATALTTMIAFRAQATQESGIKRGIKRAPFTC